MPVCSLAASQPRKWQRAVPPPPPPHEKGPAVALKLCCLPAMQDITTYSATHGVKDLCPGLWDETLPIVSSLLDWGCSTPRKAGGRLPRMSCVAPGTLGMVQVWHQQTAPIIELSSKSAVLSDMPCRQGRALWRTGTLHLRMASPCARAPR